MQSHLVERSVSFYTSSIRHYSGAVSGAAYGAAYGAAPGGVSGGASGGPPGRASGGASGRASGGAMEYDRQWKEPSRVKRKVTDWPFLIAFEIYTLLWIGVGIYAYYAVRTGVDDAQSQTADDITEFDDVTLSLVVTAIILSTLLSFFMSSIYFMLLMYHPVIIAVFWLFILVISIILTATDSLPTETLNDIAKCKLGIVAINSKSSSQDFITLIIVGMILATLVICIIVYRRTFQIACAVIQEAIKSVFHFPSSIIFVIIATILQTIVTAFAASIFYLLFEIQTMDEKENNSLVIFLHVLNLCGFVWTTNLILGLLKMILSGSFATWYWSMDKFQIPSNTITQFIGFSAKFHAGTAACGAFLMVAFKLIHQIIYFETDGISYLPNYGLGTCHRGGLIASIIEVLLEFVNSVAYIMCIVHGTAFARSAKDAISLLWQNFFKLFIIAMVHITIVYMGSMVIMVLSSLASYGFSQSGNEDISNLGRLIAASTALIVINIVFEIYEIAVTTIFLCFLEDYERNDGSAQRPFFMSVKLKELLIQDAAHG